VRILLVDDDVELVDILGDALRRAGYSVASADDLRSAMLEIQTAPPDLVVLDLNLGVESGFDLLRELRRTHSVPVLLLTGRTAEEDRVLGLDLGADDYVTKPFGYRELLARIRARLRTAAAAPLQAESVIRVGPLTLDERRHEVRSSGAPLNLSLTEFRLLRCLMLNADSVVPTFVLLQHACETQDPSMIESLRVALHRLRRKVERDPAAVGMLITVRGLGIRLTSEPPKSAAR